MKSIRSKLITYFFVFVILFNIVATAIFLSSNQLMKAYNSSFERFLLFNSISQKTNELIEKVNRFVVERDSHYVIDFQKIRRDIENEKVELTEKMDGIDPYQLRKYENVIDTLIVEGELTIGFAIRDNIDLYNDHLQEAQNTAIYLKEITLDLIDLELTEYQSFYQQLNERNDAFRQFIIYLFLTSVLLAVFFAFWFSKELNEPIQVLTNMAREVSAGKLDGKTIEIQSNDEMKILGEAFNQMRGNIRELIREMQKKSEQEQLMKELELKHLQNQVNPHFLFNTLNTISRMAFLENADQTTRLIESVSSLLRYSLGDLEKSVPLREEVKVVKDYFYIQQTRFFDRITFHTDIDDGCLETRVPRLILQPLVENAFIHGIEGREEGGEIRLSVRDANSCIIVEVADNGVGMSEAIIQKYRHLPRSDKKKGHTGHSTGLGLENVIRRLQLFFGINDLVQILSEPEKGTKIQLYLPKSTLRGDER